MQTHMGPRAPCVCEPRPPFRPSTIFFKIPATRHACHACTRSFRPIGGRFEPCWSPLTDSKSTRCGCGDTASCAALAASRNCSVLPDCFSILGTDCGWCWDATTTSGQPHGGRKGGIGGPSDGECADWTWFSAECHKHVDCAALPTCSNIMGTYCGWCSDTGVGMKGTESGPSSGSC